MGADSRAAGATLSIRSRSLNGQPTSRVAGFLIDWMAVTRDDVIKSDNNTKRRATERHHWYDIESRSYQLRVPYSIHHRAIAELAGRQSRYRWLAPDDDVYSWDCVRSRLGGEPNADQNMLIALASSSSSSTTINSNCPNDGWLSSVYLLLLLLLVLCST